MAGIRNTCIFMLSAQAIIFFVPGQAYAKYVRVLVGVMLILQICSPLLKLFWPEGEYGQILQQGKEIEEEIDRIWKENKTEESSMGIYNGIERELKDRLAQATAEYEVIQVRILDQEGTALRDGNGEKQAEKIVITVREKQMGSQVKIEPVQIGKETWEEEQLPDSEEKRLRELFGACIDVAPQRIEIRAGG